MNKLNRLVCVDADGVLLGVGSANSVKTLERFSDNDINDDDFWRSREVVYLEKLYSYLQYCKSHGCDIVVLSHHPAKCRAGIKEGIISKSWYGKFIDKYIFAPYLRNTKAEVLGAKMNVQEYDEIQLIDDNIDVLLGFEEHDPKYKGTHISQFYDTKRMIEYREDSTCI